MSRYVLLPLLCVLVHAGSLYANESYVLKRGETLYRISRKFNVPVRVLQSYNSIDNPSRLAEGTRIELPRSYVVKEGDTLYGIARSFQVELSELMSLNALGAGALIRAGRKLFLPRDAAPLPGSDRPAGQAATEPGGREGVPYWPHPGKREALQGKITGTVIHGKAGDTVVSVSAGRVVWVGPYRGYSRVVLVESPNGYTFVYAGNEDTLVRVGDTVERGTEIGSLGNNAHAGVPQLFFFVYHRGRPVDPSSAPRS